MFNGSKWVNSGCYERFSYRLEDRRKSQPGKLRTALLAVGSATALAQAGATDLRIMQHGGWSSLARALAGPGA